MTTQLTPDEASEVRILLMMRISFCWKLRHALPQYFQQIRQNVSLLRKLRTP
jgi:hypothetical protein